MRGYLMVVTVWMLLNAIITLIVLITDTTDKPSRVVTRILFLSLELVLASYGIALVMHTS